MNPLPAAIVPPHFRRWIDPDVAIAQRSLDLWAGVPIDKVRQVVATEAREAQAMAMTPQPEH